MEEQTDLAMPVDRAAGRVCQVREDREEGGKADVRPRNAGTLRPRLARPWEGSRAGKTTFLPSSQERGDFITRWLCP